MFQYFYIVTHKNNLVCFLVFLNELFMEVTFIQKYEFVGFQCVLQIDENLKLTPFYIERLFELSDCFNVTKTVQ